MPSYAAMTPRYVFQGEYGEPGLPGVDGLPGRPGIPGRDAMGFGFGWKGDKGLPGWP